MARSAKRRDRHPQTQNECDGKLFHAAILVAHRAIVN